MHYSLDTICQCATLCISTTKQEREMTDQAKAQAIQYTRRNLNAGLDCRPSYAYETQGDFRHGITQIRIVKERYGWAVLTCKDDAIAFSRYYPGCSTLKDAKAFVSTCLTNGTDK